MKRLLILMLLLCLLLPCLPALGEATRAQITIDGGAYDDRVKLRDRPGTDGAVLGQYFAHTLVEVLEAGNTWSRVRIGGAREGYMMSKFLSYDIGEDAAANEGIPGSVHSGTQADGTLTLYSAPAADASALLSMPAGAFYVRVLGTIDENWLHIRCENGQTGERVSGFASILHITQTENMSTAVVDTGDAAQKLNLREKPEGNARVIARFFSGAAVYLLFDNHVNGDGWTHVLSGDITGYMKSDLLDQSSGGTHAFALPLIAPKRADAPLYAAYNDNTPCAALPGNARFCVACERGERYLLRLETNEPYAYQYVWAEKADIRPVTRSARVAASAARETVLYWRDGDGRLNASATVLKGAQMYVYGSYNPSSGAVSAQYIEPMDEYLQVEAYVQADNETWYSGVYVKSADVDYDRALLYAR